jgi:hypothetical protein
MRWGTGFLAGTVALSAMLGAPAQAQLPRSMAMAPRVIFAERSDSADEFGVQVAFEGEEDQRAVAGHPESASWVGRLDDGGVIRTRPVEHIQGEPYLAGFAFDISDSFPRPPAIKLAQAYVDRLSTSPNTTFAVWTFGLKKEPLGEASTAVAAKALFEKVAGLTPADDNDANTNLVRSIADIVEDMGKRAPPFPSGVRQLVVFTDGGEESKIANAKEITERARRYGVLVYIVLLTKPDKPNVRHVSDIVNRMQNAARPTGGDAIRTSQDPKQPLPPELALAARVPDHMYRVFLQACDIKQQGAGTHLDKLRFVLNSGTSAQVDVAPASVAIRVAANGTPACASLAPAGTSAASPSGVSAPSATPAATAASAPPSASNSAAATQLDPGQTVDGSSGLRSLLLALAGVAGGALVLMVGAALRHAGKRGQSAVPPVRPLPSPPRPSAPSPPSLAARPASSLRPQGDNPLRPLPASELHAEAVPAGLATFFRVARPRVRVGRDATLELVLDVAAISGHHADLEIAHDGELFVTDLGSTNGTFVDGRRLAPNLRVQLAPDALLGFSQQASFRVRQPWRADAPGAAPSPNMGEPSRHPPTKLAPEGSGR